MIIDKDKPGRSKDQWSFQSFFELIGEAVCLNEIVYDDRGKAVDYRIIDVNPEYEKIFGIKRLSVIGEKASGLYGAEEAPYLDVCARVAETGKSESFESYFSPTDRYHSFNVFSPDSGLFAMAFYDITEKKMAEKKLRASEERYRNLSNLTIEGILIHEKGVAIDVNESLLKMFDYSREEIIGRNVIEQCVPAEYHSMIERRIVEHIAEPFEISGRKKDGTLFPIEIEARNIKKKDQAFRVTTIRDITERKKAKRELKQFSQSVESSPDGLVMGDLKGRITYVNKAFAGMFGYSREELMGKEISSIYPDEQKPTLKKAIEGSWSGELVARRKNGELFPVLVSASRVTDDKGKTIAHVASHRDITELKKEEREKAEMQKRLFRSEKLETIGILAGGIAHDFNNILTPIIGYTDMVLSRLSSHDPITEDLEEILSGANRAKDLVRQILTFSQQMEMEKKPIRLQQVVEEALKLLRPIIPSTIEILKEINVNCPMVMADSSQIHEVIVNLCTNAYQAMADGGGQITFELKAFHSDDGDDSRSHPILQEGEYVRLTVSDTGPGMTEEIKDHIFEPFFTTKKSEKGSGLGLSVVHGIIQSNGGEITVSSEPGKGAAFHVYLPVTKEIAKPQRKQIDSFPRGHETILLIDDETSVLELLRKILNQLGYTVDARGSSVDALEAFCKQPDKYDLILTDLTMPKMTGLDLAEEIRKTHPEFPIVLLTGYGNTISENVLKKNVSTIIGKPIDIRNLAGTLRAVLDSS